MLEENYIFSLNVTVISKSKFKSQNFHKNNNLVYKNFVHYQGK